MSLDQKSSNPELYNLESYDLASYNPEIMEELNILVRYNLKTTLEGLKIHSSSARPEVIAAAQRLFDKGLTSQADGGYLTELGRQAAQHAQDLLLIMHN